jgi:hypothetical protein
VARRRVASALPDEWVERELTGRDYGIDLLVELFEGARSTGSSLLLQIKGRDSRWPEMAELITPFPVRTLRYAETITTPVLGVFCPIREPSPSFGFLWLQEYIQVVLDRARPGWRDQRTVTLRIPAENRVPGADVRLKWIAAYPQRLRALGQLARIQHELQNESQAIANDLGGNQDRAEALFVEAKEAATLLGPDAIEAHIAENGLRALGLLRRGGPFTPDDVISLGSQLTPEGRASAPDVLAFLVRSHVHATASRLGAMISIRNDAALRRTLWEAERDHEF